jgi:hypothetical protein
MPHLQLVDLRAKDLDTLLCTARQLYSLEMAYTHILGCLADADSGRRYDLTRQYCAEYPAFKPMLIQIVDSPPAYLHHLCRQAQARSLRSGELLHWLRQISTLSA